MSTRVVRAHFTKWIAFSTHTGPMIVSNHLDSSSQAPTVGPLDALSSSHLPHSRIRAHATPIALASLVLATSEAESESVEVGEATKALQQVDPQFWGGALATVAIKSAVGVDLGVGLASEGEASLVDVSVDGVPDHLGQFGGQLADQIILWNLVFEIDLIKVSCGLLSNGRPTSGLMLTRILGLGWRDIPG